MNKLCRQVSIESPGPTIKDCVFSFEVPMPDVPPHGARIRVACAGACYRLHRTPSLSSVSSVSSISSDKSFDLPLFTSPAHPGVRDTALYPGFEVAGIVESLGSEAHAENPLKVGDRVVIFPYEGVPHGYAEFITVTDLKYLVKIPAHMPLSVAAMLPTGALLAMNTVIHAREYTDQLFKEKGENARAKILVVGTGGLALWALRIASYEFQDIENRVCISVATLRDEGFQLAKENLRVNQVQWNEDVYEKQLIERTIDACKGEVDIVIDFGTTSRSLHRSLQCLSRGGVVFISAEVAERLMPKFSKRADEKEQCIRPVDMGSIEQLEELVELVSNRKIIPPPHTVFPAEQATDVIQKLCHSEIPGRAILEFFSSD